jgi:hypothetical protein
VRAVCKAENMLIKKHQGKADGTEIYEIEKNGNLRAGSWNLRKF